MLCHPSARRAGIFPRDPEGVSQPLPPRLAIKGPRGLGHSPTFERGSSRSHIDVTFSSGNLRNKINNWRILDIKSLSLHRYISFSLSPTPSTITVQQTQTGWSTRRIEVGLLATALKTHFWNRQNQPLDAEVETKSLVELGRT